MKLDTSSWNTLTGNTCQGNTTRGIFLTTDSNNNAVSGNICNGNGTHGIQVTASDDNTVSGNTCQGNTRIGIALATGAHNNTLTGNTCQGNTEAGINLKSTSDNNTVSSNVCQGNVQDGIKVDDSDNNTIVGNTCNENDSIITGTFNGILITDTSSDNLVHSNICNTNGRYGIYLDDSRGERNWVKNNILRDNTTGAFNDGGTGTKLATKTFQFIQGTTFIDADGSAKGWEINAEADMAVALGQLPLEVQQVVRIKIWAVALGAPAAAGGQMHLDILFNAGGSLEAYNLAANSWTLANFDSEEEDYVATNVIHWKVTDAWVASELSALTGGDSFELKVNGGTEVSPDGATNATFRAIEVEYV